MFFGILAVLLLIWGLAFVAHIGHEDIVIKAIDQRTKEMDSIPATDLDQVQLESNLREIPRLMELKQAEA